MFIQSCPRCGSNRIKRGYRRTPWWSLLIGRYYLLCNSCNWEFIGYAVPGTVPANSRKRRKRTSDYDLPLPQTEKTESAQTQNPESSQAVSISENTGKKLVNKVNELEFSNERANSPIENEIFSKARGNKNSEVANTAQIAEKLAFNESRTLNEEIPRSQIEENQVAQVAESTELSETVNLNQEEYQMLINAVDNLSAVKSKDISVENETSLKLEETGENIKASKGNNIGKGDKTKKRVRVKAKK